MLEPFPEPEVKLHVLLEPLKPVEPMLDLVHVLRLRPLERWGHACMKEAEPSMSESSEPVRETEKIDEEILKHIPRWRVELLKIKEEAQRES